jgi:hypothetical protein
LRYLLALFTLIFWSLVLPGFCWAQSAFVQAPAGCGACTSLAYGSNTTSGNNLYGIFYNGFGSAQVITVTDTQGNVWTINKSVGLATDGDTVAIGCAPTSSSAADTVTPKVAGSTYSGKIVLYEVSGASCNVDASASQNVVTGPPTSCNSAAMTTTAANDFIIGACGTAANNQTFTLGSGWSNLTTGGAQGGANTGLGGEVIVGTNSTGSFTATMSYTAAAEYGSAIVAYKIPAQASAPGSLRGGPSLWGGVTKISNAIKTVFTSRQFFVGSCQR